VTTDPPTTGLFATTVEDVAKAFTEWARRYEDDPEGFAAIGEAGEYGPSAAAYLLGLLFEQGSGLLEIPQEAT